MLGNPLLRSVEQKPLLGSNKHINTSTFKPPLLLIPLPLRIGIPEHNLASLAKAQLAIGTTKARIGLHGPLGAPKSLLTDAQGVLERTFLFAL